jgi:hypothetical protein
MVMSRFIYENRCASTVFTTSAKAQGRTCFQGILFEADCVSTASGLRTAVVSGAYNFLKFQIVGRFGSRRKI